MSYLFRIPCNWNGWTIVQVQHQVAASTKSEKLQLYVSWKLSVKFVQFCGVFNSQFCHSKKFMPVVCFQHQCAETTVIFKCFFVFGQLFWCVAEGIAQHMRTIIKAGSVELKMLAQLERVLHVGDSCVFGNFRQLCRPQLYAYVVCFLFSNNKASLHYQHIC